MALIKATINDFLEDKAMQLAAALAFYTIFSLGPVLIIVLAIAGFVWGQDAARGELVGQFQGIAGEEGARQIESILQNAHTTGGGVIATIVGFVTLIIGATGVFAQLKDSLNTVWEVKPKPGRGVWGALRDRILSFGVVLAIAFLLLATLVASAAINVLAKWMGNVLPVPAPALYVIDLLVSFGIITVLFAAIYKWLPDVKIGWRDVWRGAAVTALLFTVGKFALGVYLGRSSVASVYGAAGSLIVILLWVYYSAMIFLFGAEFTQVYARKRGSKIEPSENAVWAAPPQKQRDLPRIGRPALPRGEGRRRHGRRASRSPNDFTDTMTRLAAEAFVSYWRTRSRAREFRRETRRAQAAERAAAKP